MASELHNLIEEELKNKELKDKKYKGSDEEKALMGALRVEARVKEHQHHKRVLTLKRSICIGGGLLVVIVLWIVLALKSKPASKAGTDGGLQLPSAVVPPSVAPPILPTPPSSPDLSDEYNFPNSTTVDEQTDKNRLPSSPPPADNKTESSNPANSSQPTAGGNDATDSTTGAESSQPPSYLPDNTTQAAPPDSDTSGRRRFW